MFHSVCREGNAIAFYRPPIYGKLDAAGADPVWIDGADHDIREPLGRYLDQHGVRVSLTGGAAEARELMHRNAVDPVILDVRISITVDQFSGGLTPARRRCHHKTRKP